MKFPELDHHRHHHHDHHGKKEHRNAKKNLKIMKKMAKLEKKLSKYSFENSADSSGNSSSTSSSSSDEFNSRSRSLSRVHKKHMARGHHKHGGGKRSSSSSSGSSSSNSSRSPSPSGQHRRRHQHGPPGRLWRSRSFAGRDHRSPFAARYHHHHPHPPHHRHHHANSPPVHPHHHHHQLHHRGRFHRRYQDNGVQGCYLQILTQNDGKEDENLVDLASRSVSREREAAAATAPDATSAENDEIDREVNEERGEEEDDDVVIATGPELNESLADNWSEVVRNGLPADAKQTIIAKYPVSKNCLLLRGPKINPEILPVATEAAIERDNVQLSEQNQIGTGLTALGNAITDLNNKTELKADKDVVDIIETLNDAANIILDTHHNITQTRRAFMLPEINKKVRPVVEACKPSDELLYGNDLTDKAKNVKGFGKNRKGRKRGNPENQCEKGGKRKSKRLGMYYEF